MQIWICSKCTNCLTYCNLESKSCHAMSKGLLKVNTTFQYMYHVFAFRFGSLSTNSASWVKQHTARFKENKAWHWNHYYYYVQEATACWFDMKLGYKVRIDQIFDIIFNLNFAFMGRSYLLEEFFCDSLYWAQHLFFLSQICKLLKNVGLANTIIQVLFRFTVEK